MEMKCYDALGNRYLLADRGSRWQVKDIAAVCRRHGADGMLIERPSPRAGCFCVQIYNPDGSEAENSGNGTRIFALSLWESGRLSPADRCHVLTTAGCSMVCRLTNRRTSFSSHSRWSDGKRSCFDSFSAPTQVAVQFDGYRVAARPLFLSIDGHRIRGHQISVGNPNVVIEVPGMDENFFHHFGPLIECHPAFPNRTNVQFVKIMRDNGLFLRIWERGAGSTLSSGTGACAAAIFARRVLHCSPNLIVFMAGGWVRVHLSGDSLQLVGPVRRIF